MHLNGHHVDRNEKSVRRQPRAASGSPPVAKAPDWSVVVITRNEERNVSACLASVLTAFAGRSFEIVLVDSASTDRTVEIASRFPTTIVRLAPDARLNPAAGRHFGFLYTSGSLVLFLDGDCALDADWVALAEQALRDDPGLGGVAGASHGLLPGNGASSVQDEYPRADYENPTYLAGSAAYKRAVLLRAGGFNPQLYAGEEEELGARVRKAGFRMRRLRAQMSQHHPRNPKETVPELIRRLRRRYFVGLGQLTRHALAHGLPIERPAEPIRRHLTYFALLVLGIVAAITSLVLGSATFVGAWTSFMTGLFLAFALRARGLRKPAYYFLEWTLASPMVVYGMLLTPRSIESGHAGLQPAVVQTAAKTEPRA